MFPEELSAFLQTLKIDISKKIKLREVVAEPKQQISTDDFDADIQLWADVWNTKREIVESRLRSIAGQSQKIPARLCKVRRIDQAILDSFLVANHLQGSTKAKFKYGLFLPIQYFRVLDFIPEADIREILFAVASFSGAKSIYRNEQIYRSHELIRFANKVDFTVVGGLGKLLKAFDSEQKPDDIMTYADRDWSNGESYRKLGFELVETTKPESFWVNKGTFERINRTKFEPNNNDWVLIQNSGNLKFLKIILPSLS